MLFMTSKINSIYFDEIHQGQKQFFWQVIISALQGENTCFYECKWKFLHLFKKKKILLREAVQPFHRTNAQALDHPCNAETFFTRNENQQSVTFADQQKLCSAAAAQQEAKRKLKEENKMDSTYKLFDSAKLD